MWALPCSKLEEALGSVKTISDLIDDLPLGRFHLRMALRQIFLTVCLGVVREVTPFVFQGLELEFGVTHTDLALTAALFTGGGIIGSVLISLQDEFGRLPIVRAGSVLALFSAALSIGMPTFTSFVALRIPLGIGFSFMQLGLNAWFAEFLPTHTRGALFVSLTLGHPIGRTIAILTAWALDPAHWRWLIVEITVALAVALAVSFTIPESPRSLLLQGDERGAYKVVHQMYTMNGTAFPESAERVIHEGKAPGILKASEATPLFAAERPSCRAVASSVQLRWRSLLRSQPKVLLFALVLFAGIAAQQSLILYWGPSVFQRLLYPEADPEKDALPFGILLLWSFADMAGILTSTLLIDRLGRRGFFLVGFIAAAIIWAMLALCSDLIHALLPDADPVFVLVILGTLAQATRCFVPEASHLWALETFPTSQRATMYAACNATFQATATILVPIAGYAQLSSVTSILMTYAALHLALGVFTMFLPKETAGRAMEDR